MAIVISPIMAVALPIASRIHPFPNRRIPPSTPAVAQTGEPPPVESGEDVYTTNPVDVVKPVTTIRVQATPVGSSWHTGEDDAGSTVQCDGPGEPWDPDAGVDPMAKSSCSHTYTYPSSWDDSGVFDVIATVSWTFQWSLNGVDQGSVFTFERTTELEYAVDEIHTIG